MSLKIYWSPAAEKDLNNTLNYLQENWSKRTLIKFINKVDDLTALIAEDPKLFPLINKDLGIRKCVITRHNTIFYRVSNEKLEIVRLFDTRQHPSKLKF